jgi:hypothetical protein
MRENKIAEIAKILTRGPLAGVSLTEKLRFEKSVRKLNYATMHVGFLALKLKKRMSCKTENVSYPKIDRIYSRKINVGNSTKLLTTRNAIKHHVHNTEN